MHLNILCFCHIGTHGEHVQQRQLHNSWLFWAPSEITTAHCCHTAVHCTAHSTQFFWLLLYSVCAPREWSLSQFTLQQSVCARHPEPCLFQDMYGHALTLCEGDGVLIEPSWSGGPSGAVNQNNEEPIMGALHFTGAIWLAITKKQIAMMTNKILTEAMPSSMMGWNRCYFIVIESYWQH